MKNRAAMEENLNEMKKSTGSSAIGQKLQGLINLHQKDAFNALLEHKRETDIKKRAIKMILNTNYGNLYLSFMKWKNAPPKEINAMLKLTDLQRILLKIISRKLKLAFDFIKEEFEEKQLIKNEAIKMIIKSTIGKQKYLFDLWAKQVKIHIGIEACKNTFTVFAFLNYGLKNNTSIIYQNDHDLKKKEACFR